MLFIRETHLQSRSRKTKNKKMGNMDTVNNTQNKFGAVLLISDKICVKMECITREKED